MTEVVYAIGPDDFLITVEARPTVNGAPVFVAEAYRMAGAGSAERVMQPDGRLFETLRASEPDAAAAAARRLATALQVIYYSKDDDLEPEDFVVLGEWRLPQAAE